MGGSAGQDCNHEIRERHEKGMGPQVEHGSYTDCLPIVFVYFVSFVVEFPRGCAPPGRPPSSRPSLLLAPCSLLPAAFRPAIIYCIQLLATASVILAGSAAATTCATTTYALGICLRASPPICAAKPSPSPQVLEPQQFGSSRAAAGRDRLAAGNSVAAGKFLQKGGTTCEAEAQSSESLLGHAAGDARDRLRGPVRACGGKGFLAAKTRKIKASTISYAVLTCV